MAYLKFWSGDQLSRFAGTEEVELKRVTASTPASTMPAITTLEKQTRKLAMEQQKLAQKIKQASLQVSQAKTKPTPTKRKASVAPEYEDDDDFGDSDQGLEDDDKDD